MDRILYTGSDLWIAISALVAFLICNR